MTMFNFGTMHLIRRPHRKLPFTEKFAAGLIFMTLFIVFLFSIATAPPTVKPSNEPQEKYYTIVLSEHDIYQIKKLYKANHKDIPSSILVAQ